MTEQVPSKELVCKFKRGDIVRWNALALHGIERDGWAVQGLETKNSLLPIYRIRRGKQTGSAVETDLEALPDCQVCPEHITSWAVGCPSCGWAQDARRNKDQFASLAQYLRVCADLADNPGDGVAHVSVDMLREAIAALEGPTPEPCPVPGFTTDDDLTGQAFKFTAVPKLSNAEFHFTRGGILRLMRHLERTWNRAAQPPQPARSELELAAIHYVTIATSGRSRYITENGRHQDSGGPWAELLDAVQRATATKPDEQS